MATSASTPRPFRAVRPALSLWAVAEPVAPPSEAVVVAVIQFADLREEREDGRLALRISADRAASAMVVAVLGEDAERALDVTVIWDEAEGEIVRVLDVAPLRAGRRRVERKVALARVANRYAAARMREAPAPEAGSAVAGLHQAAA